MKFYGEADKNKDGSIKSDYPSWYFTQHKEDLEESIRQKERTLEDDLLPNSEKPLMRGRLKQEKELLSKIKDSESEVKGSEDLIKKGAKELGSSIQDAMFTRSQMEKGLVDAHEEARRISEPVIPIINKDVAELVAACGIKLRDGKITRGEAEKVWKISKKALGEISNVEVLRKP